MHELRIAMFLFVSCMNMRNLLLYFARFYARSAPKIANKNLQQRTLPGFRSLFRLLAMLQHTNASH